MHIVVLDGHALNPGDLSWEPLLALGPCVIHDRTAPGEVVSRAAGAGIALTNKTILTAAHIAALPDLRYIGVLATGYNVVDLQAASSRGIPVTNVPAYSTRSTAQLTIALLLELCHHVGHHARASAEARWARSADFCFWDHPLIELDGLTLGIVGFGAIGQTVARLASGFGMNVIVHTRSRQRALDAGVAWVGLDELFRVSDVVSLHCPLTPETRLLVNANRLAQMKPAAFLLNTARGPLVDEQDLADALRAGRLAGAAVDVLSTEPPREDNPLLHAPNCLVTPHIAWATRAARARLLLAAVENIQAFLAGTPRNVVNGITVGS